MASELAGTPVGGTVEAATAAAFCAAALFVWAAMVCGVARCDGSVAVAVDVGATGAERATSDVSPGFSSDFHQASRGPDWQPINPAATQMIAVIRSELLCMAGAVSCLANLVLSFLPGGPIVPPLEPDLRPAHGSCCQIPTMEAVIRIGELFSRFRHPALAASTKSLTSPYISTLVELLGAR